jgi:hypothetical protein
MRSEPGHTLKSLQPIAIGLALFLTLICLSRSNSLAAPNSSTRKDVLCGRLVFIQDSKTKLQLIGLIPCGQSQPYIFESRPEELHDYYRFYDVVIAQGDTVFSSEYGRITTFIRSFKGYDPLPNCQACKPGPPTATPKPAAASAKCNDWLLSQSVAAFPALEKDAQARIAQDLKSYMAGPQVQSMCGPADSKNTPNESLRTSCLQQAASARLGANLGDALRAKSLPLTDVISFLSNLISASGAPLDCTSLPQQVMALAFGLNQQGYAIDILASASPAVPLLEDSQGQQAGIPAAGGVLSQIPGSQVAVASWGIAVLLPSGQALRWQARGTDTGNVSIQALRNSGSQVGLAAWLPVLTYAENLSEVDWGSSPPALQNGAQRSSAVVVMPASSYQSAAVNVPGFATAAPALPSSTPTVPAAPSATAAPAATTTIQPSPIPAATATAAPPASPPLSCPLAVGLAAVPLALHLSKHFRRTYV